MIELQAIKRAFPGARWQSFSCFFVCQASKARHSILSRRIEGMGVLIISLVAFLVTTGIATPFLVKRLRSRNKRKARHAKARSPSIFDAAVHQDVSLITFPVTQVKLDDEKVSQEISNLVKAVPVSPSDSPPIREFDLQRASKASASCSSSNSKSSSAGSQDSVATSALSHNSPFDSDEVKSAASAASANSCKSAGGVGEDSEEEEEEVSRVLSDSDQLTEDMEETTREILEVGNSNKKNGGRKEEVKPKDEAAEKPEAKSPGIKSQEVMPVGGNAEPAEASSCSSSDSDCDFCRNERLVKAEAADNAIHQQ